MSESVFRVFLICAVVAILVRICPAPRRLSVLPFLGLLASIAVYGRAFVAILMVVAAVWVVAKLLLALERRGEDAKWNAAVLLIIALALIFLIGRGRAWESGTMSVGPLGFAWFAMDMWLTLRLVTFLWEVGSGAIRPSLITYLSWCFLPFWLFGPVLRYSDFSSQLTRIEVPGQVTDPVPDWRRLSALSVAQFVLAFMLAKAQLYTWTWHAAYPRTVTLISGFTFLPLGFYLGQAGYFHAMEVLGGIGGFKLPPSFRNPLMKRNISEFWASWNMSATSVFRDYIYYNRWGLQKHHQYLNIAILFLAVGVWHGANSYWVTWGAMHAVGFCAFTWFSRHPSPVSRWFAESRFGRPASMLITYVFVCSCWILPPTLVRLAGLAGR